MKRTITLLFLCFAISASYAQKLAPKPPMGWMTWNYFADNIHEKDIREMADAMVSAGMVKAGYDHIMIDDGWQGGRDNRNNIIADPKKFPGGIKALAAYVHAKGIKLGIYSDAAPLTCAGYTASLGFEEQDAKTFASWDIDYLKYDYCGAPADSVTAKIRYKKMGDALRKSGRDIVFSICEWGDRKPWNWAAQSGGQLWRTTADVRDKWERNDKNNKNPHAVGFGIMDIVNVNAELDKYAGPGKWNDPDMLIVGLYGKKGPSGDLGGTGCTDIEYQSQMSLWSMMAAPLVATNDIRSMNAATKRILLNEKIIAINQDEMGIQARRVIKNDDWNIFVKPLTGGKYAVAILNLQSKASKINLNFKELGLNSKYKLEDVWSDKKLNAANKWSGELQSHETKVFLLSK